MFKKYRGDKKSIEARSEDGGQTWSVKLFDAGRLTEYTRVSTAEVDALATKYQMRPAAPGRV